MSRLRGGTFCLPVLLLQGLASGQASLYREGQTLCHNYLGRGHVKEACQSKRTCRECSGRHHTLLHRPTNSPPSQPSEQPTSSGTQVYCAKGRVVHKGFTHTFPRTALATIAVGTHQQRARALLDPGATISLITSRLANSLRVRSSTDISGLTGMLTNDHLVEVELSPAFTSGGLLLPMSLTPLLQIALIRTWTL